MKHRPGSAAGGVPSVLVWQLGRHGSGPKIALDLARELNQRKDVRVHLSLSRQAEIFPSAAASGLSLLPFDTYTGLWSAGARSLALPLIRKRLRVELERLRVRTVLNAMPHLWNPFLLGAMRDAGCRIVTIVHDAEAHHGDSYPLRDFLLGREIACSDRIVTHTRHVFDRLVAKYNYPPSQMEIIPHGAFRFDATVPRVRTLPRTRPFRYLFFGRLLPYKGLDLLLAALNLVDAELPIEVMIAGAGNPGHLLDLIRQHPRVKLDHRWIPEGEIAGIFDWADALVAPYHEATQSGSIAAAIGAGIPTVATPVGGLVEQIQEYSSGLIAAAVSPEAFASAMMLLATDSTLYTTLAANSLAAADGALAWRRIAEHFVNSALKFECER